MAATLQTIRTKIRRLTRNLSPTQLSDTDIDDYVNTFLLYDFPKHIKLLSLHKQFTFVTNPGQDVYPTDIDSFVGVTTNPLYNFRNKYINVLTPVYIAGYNSFYTQSREQFFSIYPIVNNIAFTGQNGDGIITAFTGVINSVTPNILPPPSSLISLLQDNVTLSAIDANGNGMAMVDAPLVDTTTGNKLQIGNFYLAGNTPATPPTVVDANNTINYLTGAYTVTFPAPPDANTPVNSQTVPMNLSLPQSLMFFNDYFTVRPVPDQAYRVNFEVFVRPSELLASSQVPELEEFWQYIAYGAAKKVYEDKQDLQSLQAIAPEYRKQENLCLRRTIVQQTSQRTSTIFTEQTTSFGSNWGGFGWGQ